MTNHSLMITKKLEFVLDTIFSGKREKPVDVPVSVLKLKLERNASEQVKFAQWLYGDGLVKCSSFIKKLILSEDPKAYFQFDYSKNEFTFKKPKNLHTDEFYYLFDYLKELYRKNNYRVIEAAKESKTEAHLFTETERYVLVNDITNHLIKLEVINDHKGNPYIIGLGYPVNQSSSTTNDPFFFRVLKETF